MPPIDGATGSPRIQPAIFVSDRGLPTIPASNNIILSPSKVGIGHNITFNMEKDMHSSG